MTKKPKVTRTERGWAGHFIGAYRCRFRRNTLIEVGEERVVVSTVGNCWFQDTMDMIGASRYYETMAFIAERSGPYWDADVTRQIHFDGKWSINADSPEGLPEDVDNIADKMHESAVESVINQLLKGDQND